MLANFFFFLGQASLYLVPILQYLGTHTVVWPNFVSICPCNAAAPAAALAHGSGGRDVLSRCRRELLNSPLSERPRTACRAADPSPYLVVQRAQLVPVRC